jgi:hypothetical protein
MTERCSKCNKEVSIWKANYLADNSVVCDDCKRKEKSIEASQKLKEKQIEISQINARAISYKKIPFFSYLKKKTFIILLIWAFAILEVYKLHHFDGIYNLIYDFAIYLAAFFVMIIYVGLGWSYTNWINKKSYEQKKRLSIILWIIFFIILGFLVFGMFFYS